MVQRLGQWGWRYGVAAAVLGAVAAAPLPAQPFPADGTSDSAGQLTLPGAVGGVVAPLPTTVLPPVQRVYGYSPAAGAPPSGVAVDAYYYPYSGVNGYESGVYGYGVVRPYVANYYSTARPAYFQPYNYYGSNYGSYYRPGLFGFAWYSPVYAPNAYNPGLNSPFSYSTGPYNGSGYLAPNDFVDPQWRY